MAQIGIPLHHATMLYEDNQDALLMGQAGQPTKYTEIKHFAIQSWVEQDLLQFNMIQTSDNSADAFTKATARTLFYHHTNHIMGKIIPSYVSFVKQSKILMSKQYDHQIQVISLNVYSRITPQFSEGGDVIR